MSKTFLEQEPLSLEASQASAWGSIRQHHDNVETAASRLSTIRFEEEPSIDPDSSHHHILSALERLPEEVLLAVMEYLDYESLYRLSQTTGYFLRLSFDSVFESDSAWRVFRHTVDGLSDGPRKRVLDGIKCRMSTPSMPYKSQVLRAPEPIHRIGSGGILRATHQHLSERDEKNVTEHEEEGETMLEFMAKRSVGKEQL
jgi:serine/threonine protein kinase